AGVRKLLRERLVATLEHGIQRPQRFAEQFPDAGFGLLAAFAAQAQRDLAQPADIHDDDREPAGTDVVFGKLAPDRGEDRIAVQHGSRATFIGWKDSPWRRSDADLPGWCA